MELRPELIPPKIDENLVTRLAELANMIDGAGPGTWDEWLEEFNRLSDMDIPFEYFQGIYGAEEHEDWVRRLLISREVVSVPDVTRDELIEIVRRATPGNGQPDYEAYMAIFDANVPSPNGSNLIFYPPNYDAETNTWDGGRTIDEYDPTPEEIVDLAIRVDDNAVDT